MRKLIIRFASFPLLVSVLLGIFCGPGIAEEAKLSSMADFIGQTVSMLTGTTFDLHMEKNETLKGNVHILYQNSEVDCIASVLSGKSKATIMDKPIAEMVVVEHPELMVFPEIVMDDTYGFGFQKGNPLVPVFNEAMNRLMAQGLENEMRAKWMGSDESAKVLIPQDWEGKNGTLRYWVDTGTPPMSYLGPEGTPIGYAVDFVLHVAREMDYRVEITECAFDGLIPALQGGKADLAGRSMSITPERLKTIDFSDPFYRGGSVMIVQKSDVDSKLLAGAETAETSDNSLTGSVFNSFRRTFIEENRWQVFVSGLLSTLLITFASMILGILLGFCLFMLCRKTGRTVTRIVKGILGVVVGIPAVVLLMVLFYVVFGRSQIPGLPVSILAFTLTFGSSVFRMLETGIGAVDYGQTEGAYALGFSDFLSWRRMSAGENMIFQS